MEISDKKCIWCERTVVMHKRKEGEEDPDNMATTDHLIPKPFRKHGENSPKVLSCLKCNTKRGAMYDRHFHPRPKFEVEYINVK